jgi:D-serine deaminase-like pyridoxal phosphate-dependent protein
MTGLSSLQTPTLVLDRLTMQRNIDMMAARARELGVPLRPHGKTPKNAEVAGQLMAAGAIGVTVSTLREAEGYFAAGVHDIFYAVALAPDKVARIGALIAAGANVTGLVDHPDAVRAIGANAVQCGTVIPVAVELDIDGYRSGLPDRDGALESLAGLIQSTAGVGFAGIMSYGGASYGCTVEQARALAETHRQALVSAHGRIEALGIPCPMVSFGSSPATLHAARMDGVTELRCGIYVFQDLFQAAIGACRIEDIAVSVLCTVIGIRPDLNRVVVDAGGLAMSKDLSTARTSSDAGYGLVCAIDGTLLPDVYMATTSQELGLLATRSGAPLPFAQMGIGTKLRILPNHADMTAAAYEQYHVVAGTTDVTAIWRRFNGW